MNIKEKRKTPDRNFRRNDSDSIQTKIYAVGICCTNWLLGAIHYLRKGPEGEGV